MLTGKVIAIGEVAFINEEKISGVVVEIDRDQLRAYERNVLYKDVIVCEQVEGMVLSVDKR